MATMQQRTYYIDNLITTTFYSVRDQVIDQVLKITPYLQKMFEAGKIRARMPDGTHWEVPIRYAKADSNVKYFGRGATFGTADNDTLTRLLFYPKNLGDSIVRYWDDDRKNRGKAKLLSYAEEKVTASRNALRDKLETDLLNQNNDPLAITALPTLISTTPTSGTVGGLDRSANDYLQNNIKNFSGLTTENSLLDEMDTMRNLCGIWQAGQRRFPDMIITTRQIYQDFERIARAMQQIVTNTSTRASLGFGDLLFKDTEIFWAPECPSGCMYFLNTEHLEITYDPEAWFEMTEWKPHPNGLDRYAQVVCVLEQTCNNFRKQGVIYNISTVSN